MDPVKRKRTIMFIGTMIVAVMFVTSYLAFGNNNNGASSSTSTTTIPGRTLTVSGSANAILENYTPNFRVGISNASANSVSLFNSTLSRLLSNGSITNLIPEGSYSFAAYSGTLSTYQIYGLLNATGFGSDLSWNATAVLSLPNSTTLYYGANPLDVHTGNYVYRTAVGVLGPPGSNVPVNILAVVYQSGNAIPAAYYVYGNNIEVTARQV